MQQKRYTCILENEFQTIKYTYTVEFMKDIFEMKIYKEKEKAHFFVLQNNILFRYCFLIETPKVYVLMLYTGRLKVNYQGT